MRHNIAIYILVFFLLESAGCSNRNNASNYSESREKKSDVSTVKFESSNFKSHAAGAKQFIQLWREGKELREAGNYQESLKVLQHAYEDVAFGRIEQAMALIESAKTSEAMGAYEIAATFYEGAAQASMNPEKSNEFIAKAQELRKKATQTEPGPNKPDQV